MPKTIADICKDYSFAPSFDWDYDTLEKQAHAWATDIAASFLNLEDLKKGEMEDNPKFQEAFAVLLEQAVVEAKSFDDYKIYLKKNNQALLSSQLDEGTIASINTKKIVLGSGNPKLMKFERHKSVKFKDCSLKIVAVDDDVPVRKVGLGTSGKSIGDFFSYGWGCCPYEGLWYEGKIQASIDGTIETIEPETADRCRRPDLSCWDFSKSSYFGLLIYLKDGYVVDGSYNQLTLIEFIGCLKAAFECDEAAAIEALVSNAFFTKTDPYGDKKENYFAVWKQK